MRLAAFTDEISSDPFRAIDLAAAWGISHVEVRGLSNGRYPAVSDAELAEFQQRVLDAGLSVSGVSPGISKQPVDHPGIAAMLNEGLPRACEWARRWGTDLVSCFGFARDDSGTVPPAVLDNLGRMAETAASHGCRLVLENEAVCWGDTGFEAAGMIHDVDADNLFLLWDPGNSARAGSHQPYPDEYEQFKELVAHVHLKNYDPVSGGWSLLDHGVVDWPGQLRALARDGFEGFVVIETHLRELPEGTDPAAPDLSPQESNTWRNLEFVRALMVR